MTRLNPPERLVENLDHAPARMVRMDAILGHARLLRFAESVSDLLVHVESTGGGLGRIAACHNSGAIVCAYIINAATEFEAAWNMLRLANVPGALRQSRVATEAVAGATLLALPTSYLRLLSADNPVLKVMAKYPGVTLDELMKPRLEKAGEDARYVPARLLATQVYRGFAMMLEGIDTVHSSELDMLQGLREDAQHPASHGSRDLMYYHFEGFGRGDTLRAGAYIDDARHDTYRNTADSLTELIGTLSSIGQRVTVHVRERT